MFDMADDCCKTLNKKLLKRSERRKSRNMGRRVTESICETISQTLSPEERLRILLQLAFEESLHVAGEELETDDGLCMEDLLNDGTSCFKEINEQLQKENICSLATTNELIKRCDDMSCPECSKIEECTTIIDSMQQESCSWDQALSLEREELQKLVNTERKPIQYDMKIEDEYSCTIIMNKMDSLYQDAMLLVGELSQVGRMLDKCTKLSQEQIETLNSKANGFIPTDPYLSPKTLIKKVSNINSCENTTSAELNAP